MASCSNEAVTVNDPGQEPNAATTSSTPPLNPGATNPGTMQVIPVPGLPEVRPGDDLAGLIIEACRNVRGPESNGLMDNDVLVVSQKVVSKAEDRLVKVDPDDPQSHKPLVVEESVRIVRRRGDLIISETKHGFVCASAGIDRSNVEPDIAALLPEDSDRSARRLRDAIMASLAQGRNRLDAHHTAVQFALRQRLHELHQTHDDLVWQRTKLEQEIATVEEDIRRLEAAIQYHRVRQLYEF